MVTRTNVAPLAIAAFILIGAAPEQHHSDTSRRVKAFESIVACRSIVSAIDRLACFDDSVQAFQTAADNRDIMVVDRAEVKQARRSLFGFNLPSLKIFGGDAKILGKDTRAAIDGEDQEIVSILTSAQLDRDGYWIAVLEDGAVWRQTGGTVAIRPRLGTTVTIRRAALGSYFMRFGKQTGVKAQRDR